MHIYMFICCSLIHCFLTTNELKALQSHDYRHFFAIYSKTKLVPVMLVLFSPQDSLWFTFAQIFLNRNDICVNFLFGFSAEDRSWIVR